MKSAARALSMLTVFALSSLAGEALAQQRSEPTTETRPVRPNRVLLISGGALFAASYIPSVAVGITSERDGDGWLWVPVVGPWADLIDRGGCGGDCSEETANKLLIISSGVAQFIGVGGVIASFIVPEEQTRIRAAATKPSVTVSPMNVGRAGYGLGVLGRF